jgi:hypothetical protein
VLLLNTWQVLLLVGVVSQPAVLLLNTWQVLLLVGMVSWPAVLLLNTWQVLLLVAGILASCVTSEYPAGVAVGWHCTYSSQLCYL